MFIKKILYVILFIIGIGLLGLGLLFLMGSGGSSSRSMTGFIMLGIGVFSLITGSSISASVKKNSPSIIDTDIMRLASRSDGRVTADMAVSDLHITNAQALESLDRLASAGSARPEMNDSGMSFVFDNVAPKKKIRKCQFCGTVYPVSQPITKCTKCGGNVKLVTL